MWFEERAFPWGWSVRQLRSNRIDRLGRMHTVHVQFVQLRSDELFFLSAVEEERTHYLYQPCTLSVESEHEVVDFHFSCFAVAFVKNGLVVAPKRSWLASTLEDIELIGGCLHQIDPPADVR